jgi:hypothetical protein
MKNALIIAIALAVVLSPICAFASASVTKFVGLGSNDTSTGTLEWTNPTNIYATDGRYAYSITTSGSLTSTNYLKATLNVSGGMGVPAGAVINGVAVAIVCQLSGINGDAQLGSPMKLVVGGVISGAGLSSYQFPVASPSWGTLTWGGPTELWGCTLTAANVNATDFGVAIAGRVWSVDGAHAGGVYVDSVQITVYYTVTGVNFAGATCTTVSGATVTHWSGTP